ncbi:hypothetical protein [Pelotomaculum sp. FP]|nr:hypothetical protein [Pelotomaculum sp. FP]
MNRFVRLLAKLKWLGLIGLLGSITGNAYIVKGQSVENKPTGKSL